MVRPDVNRWNQTLADLRQLSITAAHPRSRERFLALSMIGSEQTCATQWAREIGRTQETVLK